MDLIDRQAAIKALDGEIEITGRVNAETVIWYTRMVKDRLERLPSAQPERRWIPVTERLPEKDGDYLVCYEDGYREDYGFNEIGIAPYEDDCGSFGI